MRQFHRFGLVLLLWVATLGSGYAQCPGTQPFGLGPDTTVCSNGFLNLTPGPNFATYYWQDASTDEFLMVTDSGTYTVECYDTNGCVYNDTIYVGLSFPTPVVLSPGDSSVVCADDTTYFSITNAASFFAFLWDDGATTSDNQFDAPGLYYAIGINASGCADTAHIRLFPAPSPLLDLSSPVYFCTGDSVLVDASDPGFLMYNWSTGPVTPAAYFSAAGLYGLEVQDTNGCILRDTVSVVSYPDYPVYIWSGGSYCDDTTIVLDAGPGWVSTSWSNGSTAQAISVVVSGSYFVQVTDTNGCVHTSNTSTIVINGTPAAFTPTLSGDQLQAPDVAGYTYQWYADGTLLAGETSSTLGNLVEGTTYTVLVTTANGCDRLSEGFFYEGSLDDTPTGFSPNDDGINDQFEIPGLGPFPNNRLSIFNRYGTQVFVAEPYGNNWDGTGPSGQDLPDGTYFYILDLGNGQAPREGYIMINR